MALRHDVMNYERDWRRSFLFCLASLRASTQQESWVVQCTRHDFAESPSVSRHSRLTSINFAIVCS